MDWAGDYLAPNTSYAYTMARGSSGWEGLRNTSGNPYAGGSIALIPPAGGPINYGNNTDYDAAFALGLAPLRSPTVFPPTVSPGTRVFTGTPVTLSVNALGETPLFYQWQTDGGLGTVTNIPGATGQDLVVDTTGLLGDYRFTVVASNALGSAVGPGITITILPSSQPIIQQDITPLSVTRYAGTAVAFEAVVVGSLPIAYEWRHNDMPVPGGTNAWLPLSSLSTSDAGEYILYASNAFGSTATAPATLSVRAVEADSYAEAVIGNRPMSYWRLNEEGTTAYDYVSGNDITHNADVVATPGLLHPVVPGFSADNPAVYLDGFDDSWVILPPLQVSATAFTVCGWIRIPPDQPPYSGIFFTRDAGSIGGLHLDSSGRELRYTWNNSPGTYDWNSGLTLPNNVWTFVALVVEPQQGTMYISIQGQPLLAATNRVANAPMTFEGISYIGNDSGGTRTLWGSVDEVSVFDQALSPGQIASLFDAAFGILPVRLSIDRTSPTTATLTWGAGVLQSADTPLGAYGDVLGATSPFETPLVGSGQFYRARSD